MKVKKYLTGLLGTNCYLAVNEKTKKAVIVDPAACPENMVDDIRREGIEVEAILLTHGHFDHIMGLDGFLQLFQVPVFIHEDDKELLVNPRLSLSAGYGANYTFQGPVTTVRDSQVLDLIGYQFKVIHTPGHTQGGSCYYAESENVLFSGDTLFCTSVGRADFETSSYSSLIRSIKEKLLILPDETIVYPGHMEDTSIGFEKTHNPYV